jgi:hypothetical protein
MKWHTFTLAPWMLMRISIIGIGIASRVIADSRILL